VLAAAVIVVAAGCGGGDGGIAARRDDEAPLPTPLYAPIDGSALAFGLPDQVAGISLLAPPQADVDAEESAFAGDRRVKPELVRRGLGPSAVSIAQKSDRFGEMPAIATSAVWVHGVGADTFAALDPHYYLRLTSVTEEQYRWTETKPGREEAVVGGRPVWSSDWGSFTVIWYAWGEVLYIVMAENPQLLESALLSMPLPPVAAVATSPPTSGG
jgi:hypothetical protein